MVKNPTSIPAEVAACASEEESDENGEPATVEATMSTEASEGTAASFAGSSRVWYRHRQRLLGTDQAVLEGSQGRQSARTTGT